MCRNMENIVWVGLRESEIKYCDFIDNSIILFGNNSNCFRMQLNKNVNHNSKENFLLLDKFYDNMVLKTIKGNPNVKFMYYSQIYSYKSMEKLGLLDFIICLNNQELIEFINDKFKIKEFLKSYVPILDYAFFKGKDIKFTDLKEIYNYDSFVIQSKEGSGGSGTIILDKENYKDLKFNNDGIYMVTKYCKNNIPINIHLLIGENNITLLPISIQIIEKINDKLTYKGCDFIACKRNMDKALLNKINSYALKIGELMQKEGYRGIMGIDSICYNEEVYFMEINPRFQNSSIILNKALYEQNLPSLQELHYNCFYNKPISLRNFEVNYSSYIYDECDCNNISFNAICTLDKNNKKINCERGSYLYTEIYDKAIVKIK